jgi:carboxypeptidase family protein
MTEMTAKLAFRTLFDLSSELFTCLASAIRPLLVLALLAVAPPAFCQQGTITGTVVDSSGASVARAQVTLSLEGRGPDRETQSTEAGDFSFANVEPGRYHLSFTAMGFAVQVIAGELRAGQTLRLPTTTLDVATFSTQVNVTPSQVDIADAQIKVEEQQRILGIFPNYFVNYDRDAAPLSAKQKFELTWKGFVDPAAFIGTGISAGIAQGRNYYKGFGQGAQGYAKRYGADYAQFVTRRLIEKVMMPTVFEQDPRYFYKGTGTTRSRFFYAISRSVICRGDNKQPQLCYSSLISRFAAGALTNLYFPPADRNSSRVIFENGAIGIGGNAVGNLLQEFIARKLTRKKP